jgi:integrase
MNTKTTLISVNEPVAGAVPGLPRILPDHDTPMVQKRVQDFYGAIAGMLEAWIARSTAYNTQRSYRRAVMSFIEFMNIRWPEESWKLMSTSVADVRDWREFLDNELDQAPKTLNHRISALSGFFEFVRESAAAGKLPILLHNPAHKDFIKRPSTDPVEETAALSARNARKLMEMPICSEGPGSDAVLGYRDRAILKFYLFTGSRIRTGCLLDVSDFRFDEEDPKVRIQEKGHGKSKRTIGIHIEAAEAIREYVSVARLTSGPLFRARLNSRSKKLGKRRIGLTTMYQLIQNYLSRVPRAMKQTLLPDGSELVACTYSPHSLRATTATLLLKSGIPLDEVQQLLGHKNPQTTQIYDKRVRQTSESASHKISF